MEEGGERWSKPHVASLYLHSLFELKKYIEKGTVMLDMEANSLQQIVGKKPTATFISHSTKQNTITIDRYHVT